MQHNSFPSKRIVAKDNKKRVSHWANRPYCQCQKKREVYSCYQEDTAPLSHSFFPSSQRWTNEERRMNTDFPFLFAQSALPPIVPGEKNRLSISSTLRPSSLPWYSCSLSLPSLLHWISSLFPTEGGPGLKWARETSYSFSPSSTV